MTTETPTTETPDAPVRVKNPAAVALGKLSASKRDMRELGKYGILGGRPKGSGKGKRAGGRKPKPTACRVCHEVQPSARAAWVHCRKSKPKQNRSTRVTRA